MRGKEDRVHLRGGLFLLPASAELKASAAPSFLSSFPASWSSLEPSYSHLLPHKQQRLGKLTS